MTHQNRAAERSVGLPIVLEGRRGRVRLGAVAHHGAVQVAHLPGTRARNRVLGFSFAGMVLLGMPSRPKPRSQF